MRTLASAYGVVRIDPVDDEALVKRPGRLPRRPLAHRLAPLDQAAVGVELDVFGNRGRKSVEILGVEGVDEGADGRLGSAHRRARERSRALYLGGLPYEAPVEVVVDDPAGLHRRVRRRRPDEAEAAALELLRQRLRLRGARGQVAEGLRGLGALGRERPDQPGERFAGGVELAHGARVRERRLDLGPVADDPRVGHQALDLGLTVPGDARVVEAVEGGAEVLALAQDREPGEAGLERLERQPLVEPAVVGDRPAPLLVVVGDVVGGRQPPFAPR